MPILVPSARCWKTTMPLYKKISLLLLILALSACGGDSNDPAANAEDGQNPDNATDIEGGGQGAGNQGGDNQGSENQGGDTSANANDGFGQDGVTAFRLQAFNSTFNLMEGTSISVPITIQRVNGHQRTVSLSLRQDSSDNRLNFVLDQSELASGQAQTPATVSYLHGAKRATPTQLRVIVTANDGLSQSEATLVLNIQSTDKPDIFLLAGQSNMVGFSNFAVKDISPGGSDERIERIQQLNVTANDTNAFTGPASFATQQNQVGFPDFTIAEDPLHTSRDPNIDAKIGTQIGMGLSFAKRALTADPNHTIVLVPAAWSATGFCDTGDYLAQGPNVPDWIADGELGWNPVAIDDEAFGGTTLFQRAVVRTNMAIERSGGILRGILWHQGEADGDNPTCAANYSRNLQLLAQELRTQIVPDSRGSMARGDASDVPFIVGTLSRGSDSRGNFSIQSSDKQLVDNVLRGVSSQNLIPFSGVAILDDLVPSNGFPCGEGSCVHFGAAAYREMGGRYFSVLQSILATLP